MVTSKMEMKQDFLNRLSIEPNNGELWYEYGDFLEDECACDINEIVIAFENALRFSPDKDLSIRLGSAYSQAGDHSKAVTLITKSLNENPRAYGFCILADVLFSSGDLEEAFSACNKAIELDSENEEAYYLRGQINSQTSKKDAISDFKKTLELDPEYQLAWQALGRELVGEDQFLNEGIIALQNAIKFDANDGWAYIYLANAFWKKQNLKEADRYYKKAIKAFPNYEKFKQFYNDFLKYQEKTDTDA